MLPKKNRITYQEFNRNTKRSYSRHFSPHCLIVVKPSDTAGCRFVVVVPKYIDKRSTARHKMKRYIMHTLQECKASMVSGKDVMIRVKKTIDDREDTKRELKAVLIHAGVMRTGGSI